MSPSINQSVNPSVDIPRITHNSNATPGHEVIEQLVHGYAFQDMKVILKLFDEKAIYQDVSGRGTFGKTRCGTAAIENHFNVYFKYLLPSHTYEDTIIVGEGDKLFASWTLVLGTRLKSSSQYRVRGCDFFVVKNGKVIQKSAFLKFSLTTCLAIARIKLIELFSLKFSSVQLSPR